MEETYRQGRGRALTVLKHKNYSRQDKAGRHDKQNYREEGLLLFPQGETLRKTAAEPRGPGSRREPWQEGWQCVEKGETRCLFPASLLSGPLAHIL